MGRIDRQKYFPGNNVTSHIWYHFDSRVLRFNNRETRPRSDKLAPIRDLWERRVQRLPLMFIPGPEVTVDERLVHFSRKMPLPAIHTQLVREIRQKNLGNLWCKNQLCLECTDFHSQSCEWHHWEEPVKMCVPRYDHWTAGSQYQLWYFILFIFLPDMTSEKNLTKETSQRCSCIIRKW